MIADLEVFFDELEEFLEDHEDVRDGEDGRPVANDAMRLLMELRRLKPRLVVSETVSVNKQMRAALEACLAYGGGGNWQEIESRARAAIKNAAPNPQPAATAPAEPRKRRADRLERELTEERLRREAAESVAEDSQGQIARMLAARSSKIDRLERELAEARQGCADLHAQLTDMQGEVNRIETRSATGTVKYERRPELDKRIANGDDYAGDAWVRWVVVGKSPE